MSDINLELTTEELPVQKVIILMLAILFCTFLRISFLLIYPFIVLLIFIGFKWKLDKNAIYLFIFVLFCWLISFRNGFHIKYNLVSFYYFIPFLLLLFAVPAKINNQRNYFKMLMDSLTLIAIINNIPGIVQYIDTPVDDSFEGIYGTFTVTQNGLSVVNAILFFYHFTVYQFQRKKSGSPFPSFLFYAVYWDFMALD